MRIVTTHTNTDFDAAFGIFTEKDRGRSIVIARGGANGLNIGEIMRKLGGGGHGGAGSAMLRGRGPDAVAESIGHLVRSEQRASVQISDLMSFPVVSVATDTAMEQAASILRQKGFTGIPVVEDGKLAGVISRRDFRKLKGEHQLKLPVKAFMRSPVLSIEPGKSPSEAARVMVKHDIGRLPVVQDGRLIGIVTRSDAMRYLYDLMPD